MGNTSAVNEKVLTVQDCGLIAFSFLHELITEKTITVHNTTTDTRVVRITIGLMVLKYKKVDCTRPFFYQISRVPIRTLEAYAPPG